eukprot:2363426-Pleurochrysis_carterae.AAC.3
MTQLDTREHALGFPLSCSALINNPAPICTPGFSGYFAGTRPVAANVIQRYPHLTIEHVAALSDAERAVDALKLSYPANDSTSCNVRSALEADLAVAAPPSTPRSPPK